MLKNFVISMTSAEQRREHIRREFGKHNIAFEFFDAITPSIGLDKAITQFVPNLANVNSLSNGEKACFMSHVLLWQKCIDEDLPYIAIYEDDILLGKDSQYFLTNNQWLLDIFPSPNDFFILRFETMLMKIGEKPFKHIPCSSSNTPYKLNILTSTHYGAAAYIVSQASARYLLNLVRELPVHHLKPLDHILFRRYLTVPQLQVYQLNPAIIIQEKFFLKEKSNLDSDIQVERVATLKKSKEKLSVLAKLSREIKKIPDAIRKAFIYKKVDFHQ